MLTGLSNSWDLMKASLRVLMADKELVIFPIISSIGVLLVTLTFAAPLLLSGFFDSTVFQDKLQVVSVLVLFLFYVVQYTVIFFANTALVGAAMIRLRGGDPTVTDGLLIALERVGPILGYALISATVGMILRALSQRSHILGRAVISIIGAAWNIATYLVVPVLAVENVGPIEAVKRSMSLLKRTWGEQIAGNLGLGAVFFLFYMAEVLVFVALLALALTVQIPALIVGAIGLLILALVLTGFVQSTLEGIYAAAVYQYALTGTPGAFFDPRLVQSAFKPV